MTSSWQPRGKFSDGDKIAAVKPSDTMKPIAVFIKEEPEGRGITAYHQCFPDAGEYANEALSDVKSVQKELSFLNLKKEAVETQRDSGPACNREIACEEKDFYKSPEQAVDNGIVKAGRHVDRESQEGKLKVATAVKFEPEIIIKEEVEVNPGEEDHVEFREVPGSSYEGSLYLKERPHRELKVPEVQRNPLNAEGDSTELKEAITRSISSVKDRIYSFDQCSCKENCKTHLTQSCFSRYEEKKFACDQCPYKTSVKSYLNRHYLNHNEEKIYSCDQCPYKTNYKSHLTRHYFTHNKDRKSNFNQFSFSENSMYILPEHYLTQTREKMFFCDLCSYKTKHKSHLTRHCFSHGKEKSLSCDQCPYRTNDKSHLARHRLNHSKEKKFACVLCSYKTNHKSNLRQHCLTHSSEKTYVCGQCSYKTNIKRYWNRHCLTHIKEKQSSCDLCSYRTNNKYHLSRHYLTHSKQKTLLVTSARTRQVLKDI